MSPVGADTRLFVTGEIKEAIEAASWRWKAIDTAVKIAMPILLGISAWMGSMLFEADKRIELLERTAMTKKDVCEAHSGFKEVLGEIKVLLARQSVTVTEVKRKLDQLESKFSDLEKSHPNRR